MTSKIVAIKDGGVNQSAIEFCKRAIEANEGDDMSAFVGILFLKGGNYKVFSTRTVSHHEMVGMLTEAIHDACQNYAGGETT